ncbi:MAG TPA: hypothetical protein VJT49_02635 [Amycolatopsis sp.]|uniref:hypothetical protein n=1 Tax=Amycolatopsis sp. TaxID=37632 RepID=UPI002B470830|nr:hypothetical protein [Amycolatopsis sp.]HKS44010.1 hypothetical protein [Amycolatopsis sp.]
MAEVTVRQERVNGSRWHVKRPSGGLKRTARRTHAVGVTDLLYGVLLIAVFAVLALILRGLEKL